MPNTYHRRFLSTAERFWNLVRSGSATECWLWQGFLSHQGKGYGCFTIKRYVIGAHRFAYELTYGPIAPGLQIDHLCRNKACVNPAHLEPVTALINRRRGRNFNLEKTHCPAGHPYDEANTTANRHGRHCRTCAREHKKIFWQANAARIMARRRELKQLKKS